MSYSVAVALAAVLSFVRAHEGHGRAPVVPSRPAPPAYFSWTRGSPAVILVPQVERERRAQRCHQTDVAKRQDFSPFRHLQPKRAYFCVLFVIPWTDRYGSTGLWCWKWQSGASLEKVGEPLSSTTDNQIFCAEKEELFSLIGVGGSSTCARQCLYRKARKYSSMHGGFPLRLSFFSVEPYTLHWTAKDFLLDFFEDRTQQVRWPIVWPHRKLLRRVRKASNRPKVLTPCHYIRKSCECSAIIWPSHTDQSRIYSAFQRLPPISTAATSTNRNWDNIKVLK